MTTGILWVSFRFVLTTLILPVTCLLGMFSATAGQAEPGWTSLGAMPAPTWDGHRLYYHSAQGVLAITPISDEIIQVRFVAAPDFGRDHSYAVAKQDWIAPTVKVDIGSNVTTLATASVFMDDNESGLHHDHEVRLEKLAPHAPTTQYPYNRTGDKFEGWITSPGSAPIATIATVADRVGICWLPMPKPVYVQYPF